MLHFFLLTFALSLASMASKKGRREWPHLNACLIELQNCLRSMRKSSCLLGFHIQVYSAGEIVSSCILKQIFIMSISVDKISAPNVSFFGVYDHLSFKFESNNNYPNISVQFWDHSIQFLASSIHRIPLIMSNIWI